jgi:hypothetical protein
VDHSRCGDVVDVAAALAVSGNTSRGSVEPCAVLGSGQEDAAVADSMGVIRTMIANMSTVLSMNSGSTPSHRVACRVDRAPKALVVYSCRVN